MGTENRIEDLGQEGNRLLGKMLQGPVWDTVRARQEVQIRRGVRLRILFLLLTPFNLYSQYVTKKALEGYGDFKVGGQVIHTVKYADRLVLLAKEKWCYTVWLLD